MSDLFPTLVYVLCFLTSSACAFLLARNYSRTRARLLLWSALCFVLLAFNNLTVILDLLVLPDLNLQILRLVFALAAACVLLFGLIWDLEERR
jgi:heme/copper-type cytochrome/quinol oxidase subunit 4